VPNFLFSINKSGNRIQMQILKQMSCLGFFFNVEEIDDDILREKSKQLINIYSVHNRTLRMRLNNLKQ
jgi:hypothetical protein